jgi:AraC-like DNA-binding protein
MNQSASKVLRRQNSYRIKTSHGQIIPAPPVEYFFEIEMTPGSPDACQHVLPSVYVDMIFPVSGWMRIEGFESERTDAFVSPILRTGRKLVFGRNSKLFGIRFDAVHVGQLYEASPRDLVQGPNDIASCLKKELAAGMMEIVGNTPDFMLRSQRVDALIGKHLVEEFDTHRSICTYALEFIRSNPHAKVRDLSRSTGYSLRWIERLFVDNLATTPQEIIRITRFNRFLSHLQTSEFSSLASLASECGYYDQSHLIRDFRSFAPTTPSEFHRDLPLLSNVFNHV